MLHLEQCVAGFLALYLSTLCLAVSGRITMSFTASHNERRQARMQTRARIVLQSLGICMYSVAQNRIHRSGTFGMSKKACLYDVMLRCFLKI